MNATPSRRLALAPTPAYAATAEAMRRIGRPAWPTEIARVAGYSPRRIRAALAWLWAHEHAARLTAGYVATGAPPVYLPPSQAAALVAVQAGATTSREVADAAGLHEDTSHRALRGLYRRGLLVRGGRAGRWTWRAR